MSLTFPESGDTFVGRYEIELVLNQGGFGRVYRARQLELNRPVAIKILQPARRIGFNDDSQAEARRLEIVAKRFEREAQLVSQLHDPHTVVMFDYGATPEGLLYMVLEYVDGLPLDRLIEEEGPLGPSRTVKITRQILSSLQEAHALGMLHRDIKPANIMLYEHVGRRDQVKVLDFGLAKSIDDPQFTADDPDLTDAEVLIGTPRYMSPEQIRGGRLGPPTDMYSLGLVVYEMLTGQKAVLARSTMNTLARHINDVPIVLPNDLNVDRDLRDIVNLMLEKDLKYRASSAEQCLAMLEAWQDKRKSGSFPGLEPVELSQDLLIEVDDFDEIEPLEFFQRPWLKYRRHLLVGGGTAALLLMMFLFWGSDDPDTPVPPAQAGEPPLDKSVAIGEAASGVSLGVRAAVSSQKKLGAELDLVEGLAEAEDNKEIAPKPVPVQKKRKKRRKKRRAKKKPALRTLQ